MTETKVDITSSCRLLREEWTGDYKTISLEYTEHSPDAWYSDHVTSIELDADMAQKMVQFLTDSFPEISKGK